VPSGRAWRPSISVGLLLKRRALLPAAALLVLSGPAPAATAQQAPARVSPFSPTTDHTIYPIQKLADAVYAVLGDTGRGAEGRPNAGFINTKEGVVVVGGVASPAQGRALVRTIRTVTRRPIRWLVLYAHHPDMQFGASALRQAGAKVIAHPDKQVLAAEGGPDAMVADWDRVVGLQEMLGFQYADTPDRPVTDTDTLRLGGKTIVISHPADAHSAGDLLIWLPAERVLFAGDVLLSDGVTMVVDGSSAALLRTLDFVDALDARVIVPGHGVIPADPASLVALTRSYMSDLRSTMLAEVKKGTSMQRAISSLPPPDPDRPVSLASRKRRNAARVYLEAEKEVMGLD
jgi:glyoxylase-like metal-dependent hydrolase (beta-lactamase superfamily II)